MLLAQGYLFEGVQRDGSPLAVRMVNAMRCGRTPLCASVPFTNEMAKYVLIKTKDNSSLFLLELAQHLVRRNHTIKFFFVQCKPDSDANMHISILSNNDRINFFIDPDENALIDAITSWADKVLCY